MPQTDQGRNASADRVGGKAAVLLQLQAAGFRVPDLVVSPDDVAEAVRRVGTPLAVRSSATMEDGRAASFAGQFETYLGIRSVEEAHDAVRKCRESLHAPSVVEYCRKSGIDHAAIRMEVILQRMIEPEIAGVAFTVNPVTGAEEVVIEACEGLADELLLGRKQALPRTHPLVAKHAPEIEATARRIQRHFGAPQDIEFAVQGGLVYVLQARPITRIAFAADTGEWTNADFRDGGVASGVCTPLMWSLYNFAFQNSLPPYLREMKLLDGDFEATRMFFGRPYWNLGAVKRCLARLPGFVEREFDKDLSVQIQYEGNGIETPLTLVGILRVLPTAFAIEGLFKRQEAFDHAFLNGGFNEVERRWEAMPAEVDAAFRKLVLEDYRLTETNYFRTIYSASIAKLDFHDAFPEADYATLSAALRPMRHMEPIQALREMAKRGEKDVGTLVARFRHHSRRELDIREPRWDEDRAFVEGLLASMQGSAGEDPRPAYERARAEVRGRLPWWKRRKFDRKLDRLRKFVWLREEMRDLSSRMYYLLRRYALEIARRRGLGDDIFFMTFQEVLADDRSNIARARATYESYRSFRAPNEIGSRFTFTPPPREGALRGIGASRGKARGTARVARSVEESVSVEKGAILVCPFTDPGWTPVLDRVAGVVTETGGLLSHAAVICREYGIPAVLGVAGACDRIPDGKAVTVDGGEGIVEVDKRAGTIHE
ncbi:MAG: PEP/pyruvate-binding domain-containing protein [Planctomycetota bacterium]